MPAPCGQRLAWFTAVSLPAGTAPGIGGAGPVLDGRIPEVVYCLRRAAGTRGCADPLRKLLAKMCKSSDPLNLK